MFIVLYLINANTYLVELHEVKEGVTLRFPGCSFNLTGFIRKDAVEEFSLTSGVVIGSHTTLLGNAALNCPSTI